MRRALPVLAAAAAILMLMSAGCGGKGSSGELSELAQLAEKRMVSFDKPVGFAGAELTFTGWESLLSVGGGEGEEPSFTPAKGRYFCVFFTLEGAEGALPAAVDPSLFKLRDISGKLYYMDEAICQGPASALAAARGLTPPWALRWDQPGKSDSLVVFDAPFSVENLTLVVDVPPGGGDPSDRIELALGE